MSNSTANSWATSIGADDALEGRLRRQMGTLDMERALGLAVTSLDRRCVEAVHQVLTDEEVAPGYVHAGLAMTALPHKWVDASEWVRGGASAGCDDGDE